MKRQSTLLPELVAAYDDAFDMASAIAFFGRSLHEKGGHTRFLHIGNSVENISIELRREPCSDSDPIDPQYFSGTVYKYLGASLLHNLTRLSLELDKILHTRLGIQRKEIDDGFRRLNQSLRENPDGNGFHIKATPKDNTSSDANSSLKDNLDNIAPLAAADVEKFITILQGLKTPQIALFGSADISRLTQQILFECSILRAMPEYPDRNPFVDLARKYPHYFPALPEDYYRVVTRFLEDPRNGLDCLWERAHFQVGKNGASARQESVITTYDGQITISNEWRIWTAGPHKENIVPTVIGLAANTLRALATELCLLNARPVLGQQVQDVGIRPPLFILTDPQFKIPPLEMRTHDDLQTQEQTNIHRLLLASYFFVGLNARTLGEVHRSFAINSISQIEEKLVTLIQKQAPAARTFYDRIAPHLPRTHTDYYNQGLLVPLPTVDQVVADFKERAARKHGFKSLAQITEEIARLEDEMSGSTDHDRIQFLAGRKGKFLAEIGRLDKLRAQRPPNMSETVVAYRPRAKAEQIFLRGCFERARAGVLTAEILGHDLLAMEKDGIDVGLLIDALESPNPRDFLRGLGLTIDHIIDLGNGLCGGVNLLTNLAVMSSTDNQAKNALVQLQLSQEKDRDPTRIIPLLTWIPNHISRPDNEEDGHRFSRAIRVVPPTTVTPSFINSF